MLFATPKVTGALAGRVQELDALWDGLAIHLGRPSRWMATLRRRWPERLTIALEQSLTGGAERGAYRQDAWPSKSRRRASCSPEPLSRPHRHVRFRAAQPSAFSHMTLQDRIDRLQDAAAHGAPLEQLMLREPVLATSPNGTRHPGASTTYLVVFESRRQAIFKPFAGQHPNACANYQQDPFEAVVHEVVAWRLAHAMGGLWEQLIPASVLRHLDGIGPGAMINWRRGSPDQAVFDDARAQAHAAAFWDALIGQQDRHASNFRYDLETKRLALIDNAFAFARPGDLFNHSLFLARRRSANAGTVTKSERAALEALLDGDLFGLPELMAPERAEALRERARRMLQRRMLILPGDF